MFEYFKERFKLDLQFMIDYWWVFALIVVVFVVYLTWDVLKK
jgi:hypothetical protein